MMPNSYFPYIFQAETFPNDQTIYYHTLYSQLNQNALWLNYQMTQNFPEKIYNFQSQNTLTNQQFTNLDPKQEFNRPTESKQSYQSYEFVSPNKEKKNQNLKSRQKYGRNITSNIFRSLIKRISSEVRFKKLALKIIAEKNFTITYDKFIEELHQLSLPLSSYVKKNEMKKFILPKSQSKESLEFAFIFRILGKIYLRQQHVLNIYYSKKINKESRNLHYILSREMEQMLK